MAFTPGELTSIANAALDYYFEKGKTFKQSIENKPLIAAMERKAKTFARAPGIRLARPSENGAQLVDIDSVSIQ